MSKKKVSGSTMTLKDFHGGSIPSDIPLPSAPGVTVRTSDRPGYDRSSRGAPMARPDHWSRPHTSPATRRYDDKIPFFPHTAPIGRNFDEDERKPLGGGSAPRRTISDDSIHVMPSRVEVKPEYGVGGSSLGRQVAPVSHVGTVNSYSARLPETAYVGVNSQSLGGSNKEHGTASGGGFTNVWAMRKEAASVVEPEQSWARPNAVSKLAYASALEKVSSGRWQSKAVHYQTDPDVVRSSEVESEPHASVNVYNAYNRVDAVGEENYDAILAAHAERGLGMDSSMRGGRNELLDYERSGVPKYSEVRPRSVSHHVNGALLAQNDGKHSGPELQQPVHSEPTVRPKLNSLPKVKPLERTEPYVTENAQGYRQVNDSGHVGTVYQAHGHANFVKPVSTGNESGKEVGHRPKLNLKPRSEPLEQLEGNAERERKALFGGARPRELVLKERGIDDVTINSYDVLDHSSRVEHNISRTEKLSDRSVQTCYGEKTDDAFHDQRTGRKPERKDQRVDTERVHTQKNWRGDNRRNVNETDRQQPPERPKSPETWRKPVDQPKPSPGGVGVRYGRAASAVELAQAFSRSVSDPKVNDRFSSGQRDLNTSRTQVPFSRLVGPTSRPKINGY
ncbi:hypothetical protein TanjilG_25647 [Lupinus angustifolius]|uniref:Eukaryotic translation initiation factor-related n=1 Tax=Lupinus angustifolius TaxID=3871 RepID=A0A4P1QTI4_LUPAN|nr:PREDICTED: uncharacterized protein LOC109331255 [Lupinus angustifolius]XP_019421184.1 PREDICTED: uncharacterized protein LOC109331255 [Lupinus angustifolius]OIV94585.1 hypothetical protein TanjilG_25647 [Lupinus angustifolius]